MDNQQQHTEAKTCPRCRTPKLLSEFYIHRLWTGKIALQSWCKECKRADTRERRRNDRRGMLDGRKVKDWRPPWGERSHKAKLSEEDVKLIRELKGVLPAKAVAPKFDIKPRTVYAIWQGQYWEHVG